MLKPSVQADRDRLMCDLSHRIKYHEKRLNDGTLSDYGREFNQRRIDSLRNTICQVKITWSGIGFGA